MDKLELLDRAIKSAQCRIISIKRGKGIMFRYPRHGEGMIAKEEVTIEALKFYKDSLIFFGAQERND